MRTDEGQQQLRKGRFSQPGAVYSVTVCCDDRRQVFTDPANVDVVFESLDWLERQGAIALECCVVMPDHVHLVFGLAGSKSLSEVMKAFKQFTARRIRLRSPDRRRVWQSQYYDHCLRRDEDLVEVVRYCRYNPVRAGLVREPDEYPHWRSRYVL